MTARSVSMGAPFTWFMKALDVGRRNPKALFGGFALMMLVGLVPTVLQMSIEFVAKPEPLSPLMFAITGFGMLVSVVLMPPLVGAALRLIHDGESGRPVSATDVFDGYRDTAFAVRMIQVSLLMLLVSLALLGLLYVVMPGKPFFLELFTRMQGLAPGQQPDLTNMPAFPPAFLLWMLAAFAALMVLSYAQMLAISLVALGGERPVAAVGMAFAGVLRNVLPFTGFTLAFFVISLVVGFVLVLVIGLVATVLAVVSPALAVGVLVPFYLAFLLLVYVLSFSFNYQAWLEIFDGEMAEPAEALAL